MAQTHSKPKRTYNKLTPETIEFFKESYLFLSDETLARVLGYNSPTSVRKIRQLLGLKRDKKTMLKALKDTPLVVWLPREWYGQRVGVSTNKTTNHTQGE